MPDRDGRDSVGVDGDLDEVFGRFVDGLAVRSRGPGAEAAVLSARRRRWTTAGVTIVVIAVLAGILGGAAGLPGRESAAPVAPPATGALPEPRRLDLPALEQATRGWVDGWEAGTPSVSTDLPCAASVDASRPQPLDHTTREFAAGSGVGATLTVERYANADQAHDSPAWLVDPKCEGEEVWALPDEIWNGGDSVGLRLSVGRQRFHYVVVIHGAKVATLSVAGAGIVPETVRQRVVRAMLADLLS